MSKTVLRIFLIAGEHSGDILGAKLITAIRTLTDLPLELGGVGGEHMAAAGLESIFPLSDVAVMGPFQILKRLPPIIRRVYQTVDAALAFEPDIVVIVDSPEFTHPIAKRIRRRRADIPIIDYVSPTVWAWRPGRARKMKPYVDHLLALLPFEPEAHARLGGPPCTYIGHSLVEELDWIQGIDCTELASRLDLDPSLPVLAVLPGSRKSEVEKLVAVFGETLELLGRSGRPFEVIVPTVPWVRPLLEKDIAAWSVRPHLVEGRADMFSAFRLARCALAASGTVTLELAAAGVPMAVAYKVDPVTAFVMRRLVTAHSAVLPNLILGRNAFPEFIQQDCRPEKLAATLAPLFDDSGERQLQLAALAEVEDRLRAAGGSPSRVAAAIVLDHLMADRRG
ncbi:MAG: hypothetical protein RLZ98_346 [Pseudomonadota bacterium]|jgi:lipid-A-disaccharide synthase